jgi:dTMP kinase
VYILFEGVDTCGKSTQAKLLHQSIDRSVLTKEPGGSELGVWIRETVLNRQIESKRAELLLFLADRAEHYKRVIEPNLDKTIISDRGLISGIAYAMANEEIELDFLIKLNLFALENHLPDKVILLESNRDLILERLGAKEADMIEKRGIDYLLKIQENMKRVLKKLDLNYLIIDARKSIEKISQEVKEFVDD